VLWALSSLMVAEERITRYLEREGLLPGFVVGYTKIHHDEHRHIGYGTWYLQTAVAADITLRDEVRQTLRDLLPAVAASLAPPDRGDDTAGTRPAPAPTRYAPSPSTG
jgi:hypothetical protein